MKVLPIVKNKYTKFDLKYIYFMQSILQIHLHIMCLIKIPCNYTKLVYLKSVKIGTNVVLNALSLCSSGAQVQLKVSSRCKCVKLM